MARNGAGKWSFTIIDKALIRINRYRKEAGKSVFGGSLPW